VQAGAYGKWHQMLGAKATWLVAIMRNDGGCCERLPGMVEPTVSSTAPWIGDSLLRSRAPVLAARFAGALRAAGPPLLFGVRMWAAVSLALYIAFWLELDNPYWAGLSAAIVCQPQLGASLRKGWFRMVGTMIGAVWSVVLVACFPQDRILLLGGWAAWSAACAFAATVLRNFASYAAALAGITSAIITADLLAPVGGVDANAAFLLAVARASETCIGIVGCQRCLPACRRPRQRDLHRHRLRRRRSRRHRFRRRRARARCSVR